LASPPIQNPADGSRRNAESESEFLVAPALQFQAADLANLVIGKF
jgi:hypothetical protein